MPKATSENTVTFDGQGKRWADALRRRYPTAKHVARVYHVAKATAEGWLAGQLPQQKHLHRAAEIDPNIIAEVYAPGHAVVPAGSLDAQVAKLLDELALARNAVERTEALIREALGK